MAELRARRVQGDRDLVYAMAIAIIAHVGVLAPFLPPPPNRLPCFALKSSPRSSARRSYLVPAAIDRDFIDEEIRGARVLPARDEVRIRGELAWGVEHFINSHATRASWCYRYALARRPSLRGRVSMRVVIGERGEIKSATIVASELGDADLERCIADHALRWHFRAPDDGRVVTITYPLDLSRTAPPPWLPTKP